MPVTKRDLVKGGSEAQETLPMTKTTKHNRSRGGCTRCRQRRQKCDEQKPRCKRCEINGVGTCVYEISLQWGGRNFQNYARNEDIKKLETEPGTFVYVASSSRKESGTSSSSQKSLSPISTTAISTSPGRSFSPLETAKPMERLLLHHFAHEASKITSCHSQIHRDFCKLLLPMALEYPPLLNALTALSAIHRNSLYTPPLLTSSSSPSSSLTLPIPEPEANVIISLKASSVSQLRHQLLQPRSQPGMRDAVLATVLALCMCEIHSGGDRPRSWRLHLEGAKAILSTQPGPSGGRFLSGGFSQHGLLGRWYTSIEALAALSDHGLKAGQLPPESSTGRSTSGATGDRGMFRDEEVYLDDYFGFATDLAQKFVEIGALAYEHRSLTFQTLTDAVSHVSLSESDLRLEACALEAAVQNMIFRDTHTEPKFYPGVRELLKEDVVKEFMLCNEAYQHTALLHIYRRILCLPPMHYKIRDSVERILECVRQIRPQGGLSPYIVLNVPLFTAGREALAAQREEVRNLMRELAQTTGLRNIWKGLEILETRWKDEEAGNTHLLDTEECDFIPY